MNNLPQSPYRLEERFATGELLAATEQGWDGPLTADEAQRRFAREVREHPGRYDAGSPYRLLLLGPDRATQPTARGERRAEPGEVCTCGRPAVRVFTGGPWGDTGYCGLPDGGLPGPCPWCGGARHDSQRCPQYRIVPAVK